MRPPPPSPHLIPPSILTTPDPQSSSSLLTALPTEILHRILLSATDNATILITRLFISLSCKSLALLLANASGQSSAITKVRGATNQLLVLKAGSRPLLKKDIPRNFYTRTAPTAVITSRMGFMLSLSKWMRVEDGWVFCSTCTVYKRLGGGLGAETSSWRSFKKVLGKDTGREVKEIEDGNGSNHTRYDSDNTEMQGEEGVARNIPVWTQHEMTEEEWERLSEEWMMCQKHRAGALQMVMFRDN